MNEKLIIRNFCGIENIEMEIGDITVLIGPQATGKSICAKSLYFFKRFIWDLRLVVNEEKTKKDFDEGIKRQFEEYFPKQSWTPQFLLRYEVLDTEVKSPVFIQIKKSAKPGIKLSYSDAFKTIFELATNEHKRVYSSKIAEETQDYKFQFEFDQAFEDIVTKYLGDGLLRNQLFIPAGRSFFGILQSSIFSFLATNTAIDPFLKSFGSFYENVKTIQRRKPYREDERRTKQIERLLGLTKKVDTLVSEILKGQYLSEKGKDYLVSVDGRKTNLTNASSGQQETLPLALILKYLQARYFVRRSFAVYIEEPEAHIFPMAQKQIIQLISLVYNSSKENIPAQFLITTHSPYTLTALNNLMYAGQLAGKFRGKKREEIYNVVDPDMILNPENIRCYSLKNGLAESIISPETNLIDSVVIDDVSDDLSMEFGKLLELS